VCDLETSRKRRPWPTVGWCVTKKNNKTLMYIFRFYIIIIIIITKVIPVTIVATGTISNSFRKYVSNTPGKN